MSARETILLVMLFCIDTHLMDSKAKASVLSWCMFVLMSMEESLFELQFSQVMSPRLALIDSKVCGSVVC